MPNVGEASTHARQKSMFGSCKCVCKGSKGGRHGKVKSLQWLLTHSFYGRYLAVVRRTTNNKGKNTAGVDNVRWSTDAAKVKAIDTLKRRGY